jgi:hypothetical protein
MLEAFDLIELDDKRIIWIVNGADYDLLQKKAGGRSDLVVMRPHPALTSTMMASDVIITKGNRTPLLECDVLGLHSLSLSHGHNAVDDYRTARIRSNTSLRVRGLNASILRDHIVNAMEKKIRKGASPEEIAAGRVKAAQLLLRRLDDKNKPEGPSTDGRVLSNVASGARPAPLP